MLLLSGTLIYDAPASLKFLNEVVRSVDESVEAVKGGGGGGGAISEVCSGYSEGYVSVIPLHA